MSTAVRRWHPAVWAASAATLLVPLVAMRFTGEVNWTGSDFAVAAVLLGGAAGAFEWLAKRAASGAYRAGAAVAVLTGLALVWVTAAIGIVGAEDDPANLLFAGVLAAAAGGALLARGRAAAMARAMAGAALAQVAAGALALGMGWGLEGPGWPGDVLGASAVFTAGWLAAAGLFARSVREG